MSVQVVGTQLAQLGSPFPGRRRRPKPLTVDGESPASLLVSRKEQGTVLEGSHLPKTPRQVQTCLQALLPARNHEPPSKSPCTCVP